MFSFLVWFGKKIKKIESYIFQIANITLIMLLISYDLSYNRIAKQKNRKEKNQIEPNLFWFELDYTSLRLKTENPKRIE